MWYAKETIGWHLPRQVRATFDPDWSVASTLSTMAASRFKLVHLVVPADTQVRSGFGNLTLWLIGHLSCTMFSLSFPAATSYSNRVLRVRVPNSGKDIPETELMDTSLQFFDSIFCDRETSSYSKPSCLKQHPSWTCWQSDYRGYRGQQGQLLGHPIT